MRTLPAWVQGILAGLFFGIAMGAFIRLDGASWTEVVLWGLGAGVALGVSMGRFAVRQRREFAEAEGDLPAEQVQAAHQAVSREPVPYDPDVRAAAVRIGTVYLKSTQKHRWVAVVLPGLMLVGAVGAAFERSLWTLLYVPAAALMVYINWFWPRRLRRRIDRLSSCGEEDSA
ncbi:MULTISPECIES: hypothetical protein [unclassified Kribbella]|uniref:hypothetical protein n=1 Tax=unclassified Kribbella TaxID=2644121 RepID=UPI00301894B2